MISPAAMRRYQRQIGVYRDRTAALLIAAWDDQPGIDRSDIPTFTTATAPALAGGKAAAVSLSAAFFALVLGIRPVGVNPADVMLEPDTEGPFRAAWHALAMGRSYAEAVQVGRSTAQAVGFDFVQSAARRTGDVVAERSDKHVRWARVPGGNACEWCLLVAGQSYTSAEAADFGHERDDCDVVPDI